MRAGALLVGAVGLATVGLFTFRGFVNSSGGATSPEAAVRKLVAAAEANDPIAVLESLEPDIVRPLVDLYPKALEKARQLGFLSGKEQPTSGLGVTVEGLQLHADPAKADTARVSIVGGTLQFVLDPARLPKRVQAGLDSSSQPQRGSIKIEDLRRSIDEINRYSENPVSGVYVMTVRRGGRWYVSPSYTIAEYFREGLGLPAADFGAASQAHGAKSAREAVENLISVGARFDLERALSSLPPDELAVVYDYANVIRGAIPAGDLQQARDSYLVTITSLQLGQASLPGDKVKVFIDEIRAQLRLGGFGAINFVDVGLSKGCLTVDAGEGRGTYCLSDVPFGALARGVDRPFLVAVKSSGGWYVSPVETAVEYGRVLLENVRAEDIDLLVGGRNR